MDNGHLINGIEIDGIMAYNVEAASKILDLPIKQTNEFTQEQSREPYAAEITEEQNREPYAAEITEEQSIGSEHREDVSIDGNSDGTVYYFTGEQSADNKHREDTSVDGNSDGMFYYYTNEETTPKKYDKIKLEADEEKEMTRVTNTIINEKQEEDDKKKQKSIDYQQLESYLKERADGEDGAVMANILAVTYFNEGKTDEAITYFEKAAEAEYAPAQRNLAIVLEKASDPDQDRAFELYSAAAKNNDAYALNNLGCMYMNGEGCEKSHKKAVKCFKQAAETDSLAKINLANCCMLGIGIRIDYKRAFNLYSQVEKDDENAPAAYRQLAMCYLEGKGTKKDVDKARKYFQLSAERGDAESAEMLKKIATYTGMQRHSVEKVPENVIGAAEKNKNKKPSMAEQLAAGQQRADAENAKNAQAKAAAQQERKKQQNQDEVGGNQ